MTYWLAWEESRAVGDVAHVDKFLEAIYEVDVVGFSYGFRPGRGQHYALDALFTSASSGGE
jgi:hypothetical protein